MIEDRLRYGPAPANPAVASAIKAVDKRELDGAIRTDELIHIIEAGDPLVSATGSEGNKARLDAATTLIYAGADPAAAFRLAARSLDDGNMRGAEGEMRRSIKAIGSALFEMNAPGSAIFMVITSLRMARNAGDKLAQATTWNHLGAIYLDSSLIDKAEQCFRVAGAIAANGHLPPPDRRTIELMSAINLAVCALYRGRCTEGIQIIEAVLAGNTTPLIPPHLATAHTLAARLRMANGDMPEAIAHATKALRTPGARSSSSGVIAEAILAYCLHSEGSEEEAINRGLQAWAGVRVTPPSQRAAYSVLAALSRRADMPRHADSVVREHSALMAQSVFQMLEELRAPLTKRLANVPELAPFITLSDQERLVQAAAIATAREDTSMGHSFRVGRIAHAIALSMGQNEAAADIVATAGTVHDVGMLCVPAWVAGRAAGVRAVEDTITELHTAFGSELIAAANIPNRAAIQKAVRHHHERWDGAGFPGGLLDRGTPFAARVVGIADVYDEAVNPTQQRDAFSHEDAIAMISAVSGRVFGPDVVKHLRKSFASGALSREIIQGPPASSIRPRCSRARCATRASGRPRNWPAPR